MEYTDFMTESELIQNLKQQNEEAFSVLVKQYQDQVVNTCFGFVHDKEDARDLAQEVFVEVYHSIRKFREESGLGTWLYRIAVNKSLDFILRKNRKKRFGIHMRVGKLDATDQVDLAARVDNPHAQLEEKERFVLLREAIARLPKNQRIAITLQKFEECPSAKIAEIMNTSVAAVESLLHRAKANLYQQLEKRLR